MNYEIQLGRLVVMRSKGGRPRKLTPIEEMGVYQMHKEGRPQAEIAYKHGIGTTTVYRIVKRFQQAEGEKSNEK